VARWDYDLIVLGGGAAGLTGAGMAATLGAKTLLVERHRLGGDCTWTGCIPSKALLDAAHAAHALRTADRFGLKAQEPELDYEALMARVHRIRERVYEHADSPERLAAFHAETASGEASFVGPRRIRIEGEERWQLSARKVLVATGARPRIPAIEGATEVPHWTSETLFEGGELPRHLVVLGAGPIGMEMAQAFRRLGAEVTVISRGPRALEKDDAANAAIVREALESEGVRFLFGVEPDRFEKTDGGLAALIGDERIEADRVLYAIGRAANIEDLQLANAGLEAEGGALRVSDRCRTANRHVYAAGDVSGRAQLTHWAEHMSKTAITNAILKVPAWLDEGGLTWSTFTDPAIAQLGPTEAELRERGKRFVTHELPYTLVDRAQAADDTRGQLRVHATRWGKILGVSIVGARADDLIGGWALAKKAGMRMSAISSVVHPYPSYGLANRRAADQWFIRHFPARLVRLWAKVLRYRGEVPTLDGPV